MGRLVLKEVRATIRPARIAVLFPADCDDWVQVCLSIIEQFSLIWGGEYNIIIPVRDNEVKPPFDDILTVFDPDYVFRYQPTWAQVERFSPERFEKKLQQKAPHLFDDWAQRNPSFREPHMRMEKERLRGEPLDGPQVSKDVVNEWIERVGALGWDAMLACSPHPEMYWLPGTFSMTAFVASGVIRDFTLLTTNGPDWYKLWLAEQSGAMPEEYLSLLEEEYDVRWKEINFDQILKDAAEAVQREIDEVKEKYYGIDDRMAETLVDSDDLSQKAMKDWRSLGFMSHMPLSSVQRLNVSPIHRRIHRRLRDELRKTPFTRCMHGLTQYEESIGMGSSKRESPSLTIVGFSPEDFCLYYCLTRLSPYPNEVGWRPDGEGHNVSTDRGKGVILSVSSNIGIENLTGLLNEVRRVGERSCIRVPVPTWFEEARDGLTSLAGFESPYPRSFPIDFVSDQTWLVEIKVTQFSAHRSLDPDKQLLLPTDPRNPPRYRITLPGNIAYQCPYTSEVRTGHRVPSVMMRPKIVCPNLLTMLQKAYKSRGDKYDVRLSDKGQYLEHLLVEYGDITKLNEMLVDDQFFRQIADELLAAQEQRENKTTGHGEREAQLYYLKSQNLAVVSDDALFVLAEKSGLSWEQAKGRIAEYLQLGLMHRGVTLKCLMCSATHFYRLEEIGRRFQCKRCGNEVFHFVDEYVPPVESERTFMPVSYRLDEIVALNIKQGNREIIQALCDLKSSLGEPFMFTEPVEFLKGDARKCEVDFVFVSKGLLGFGEVSKAKDITEKLTKSALSIRKAIFGKLGAKLFLIYHTHATRISEARGETIKQSFADSNIEVRFKKLGEGQARSEGRL